jgi:2,4-dienoyl-CoA reductase-like NADH-dependent reductase (Old Yellow Enzyme family)
MAFKTEYPHVFSPLKIGPMTTKNRLVFAPHVANMVATDGEVTQEYVDFIDGEAKTGVGIVNIGATPINWESAPDYYGELNATDDKYIAGLVRLADTVHVHGAKISVELLHAGRGADPQLLQLPYALSASTIPLPDRPRFVKEMDQHDIDKIIEDYQDVVTRLQTSKFDMVMIHAAHSNLIAQFLSPLTNFRSDNYGGSLENRMRFLKEILQAVREAVGPSLAIDMRISGSERIPGGMEIEEVTEVIKMAQEYINTVHISAGWITDQHAQFNTMPPYYKPLGLNVPLAAAVKADSGVTIPVTTVGAIKTLAQAEEILATGKADMVAMARALICDPELIKKSQHGKPETVRPCLRCWGCADSYGSYTMCTNNPEIGRTGIYARVVPAFEKKKVVVVGGGTAGCTAVQTLVKRGHEVVLFEKSDRLGGMINEISSLSFKQDLRDYLGWLQRTVAASGADVRLNTPATVEAIEAENPDLLFIATGSNIFDPPVPGIDKPHVKNVLDVDNNRVEVGQRVVVCGGGVSGLECALELAYQHEFFTIFY